MQIEIRVFERHKIFGAALSGGLLYVGFWPVHVSFKWGRGWI